MATKSWQAIQAARSKRSAEDRAATKARALRELALERASLAQVRRARAMTQATIAQVMQIAQGDVSRLEHRTDAYIGTLRRYVEALGGTLRIVAEFPDTDPVEIEGFGTLPAVHTESLRPSVEPIHDDLLSSGNVTQTVRYGSGFVEIDRV